MPLKRKEKYDTRYVQQFNKRRINGKNMSYSNAVKFQYWGLGIATGLLVGFLVLGTIMLHEGSKRAYMAACEPVGMNSNAPEWLECPLK